MADCLGGRGKRQDGVNTVAETRDFPNLASSAACCPARPVLIAGRRTFHACTEALYTKNPYRNPPATAISKAWHASVCQVLYLQEGNKGEWTVLHAC